MARSGLQGVKNWLLASILAPLPRTWSTPLYQNLSRTEYFAIFSFRSLPIRDEWINRRKKIFIWKMFATRVAWMTAQAQDGPRKLARIGMLTWLGAHVCRLLIPVDDRNCITFTFDPLRMVRRQLKLFISLFACKYQETRMEEAIFRIRTSWLFYCQMFIELFW